MKNFQRNNLAFSLCGLNCGLCPMRIGEYCPGCGGGEGNQACSIAKCSLQHGKIEYCFLCPEFPCSKYDEINESDSFISHQSQLRDIQKARRVGIDRYNQEQESKVKILKMLLDKYNDGRRKSFYCMAVSLLPLQEMENILTMIKNDPGFEELSIQEKAKYLVSQFQNLASKEGITLKLRKKK